MARKTKLEGFGDLEQAFKELGKVPQTIATQSARAGAGVALSAAKRNAPKDTGNLKSGIIMKRERRVKVGKTVYDVMMDPSKNDLFVKVSKGGKRAYYPASQEYGFLTVNGGYVPGKRYFRRAIMDNVAEIEQRALDKAGTAIDKAWNKKR